MPREGHPLKEGLRQFWYLNVWYIQYTPREGHPLKEGLRLITPMFEAIVFEITQRGSSTKRGIKT